MFHMLQMIRLIPAVVATSDDFVQVLLLAGIVIGLVLGLIFLTILLKYGRLWLQAYTAGVAIGLLHLIAMQLRRVPPERVVAQLIRAHQAGLGAEITRERLEGHCLAGGDIEKVVQAVIADHNLHRQSGDFTGALTWNQACAINLSSVDLRAQPADSAAQ